MHVVFHMTKKTNVSYNLFLDRDLFAGVGGLL